MDVSVEVSMYPLKDEFIPAIDEFIAMLNAGPDVEIRTNSMSTQLFGEYARVMNLLSQAMQQSFERFGQCVFVAKILCGDARAVSGYD